MYIKQLYSPQNGDSVAFKPENRETVSLTDEEQEAVLRKALDAKIGRLNSAKYLQVLNAEPVFITPTYDDLQMTLFKELEEIYGWDIDQYNEPQVDALCMYFSNDERFEEIEPGFSLKKGLLLFGPVGCGKTTLLKIMSRNTKAPFGVISCRKIAEDFAQHGHNAITNYSKLRNANKRENLGHDVVGICFDDMGTETNKKNFGNEANVMAEVILNLYDYKDNIGRVHLTTNISDADIIANYGERVFSRLKEMVNIIEFPFNAPDRRK
jgi:DNA replication protein DnaC